MLSHIYIAGVIDMIYENDNALRPKKYRRTIMVARIKSTVKNGYSPLS